MPLPILVRPEELNRVLLLARDLKAASSPVSERALALMCTAAAIRGQMPNHNETIHTATELGFFRLAETGGLRFTRQAEDFLSLNVGCTYDLAPGQAAFIVDHCIVQGPYRPGVVHLLSRFHRDANRPTFSLDTTYTSLDRESREFVTLLRRLGVIMVDGNFLIIDAAFVSRASMLRARKKVSLAELKETLERRTLQGKCAEEWVLRHEQERLSAAGYSLEAAAVRVISDFDVAAGYDIESFDAESPSLTPTRFIEVKSNSTPECSFVISDNELAAAAALGEQYWLYLLTSFNYEQGTGLLHVFHNLNSIVAAGEFDLSPISFKCSRRMP